MPIVHWGALDDAFLLDVRNPPEIAAEAVAGAVNIPLPQLRSRLGRAAARPGDRGHLPLGGARLLRDTHPGAERFPGQEHLGRHVLAIDARCDVTVMTNDSCKPTR